MMYSLFCTFISCSEDSKIIKETEEKKYPNDSSLRITDGQVWGTHNSYHIAPESDVVSPWNYSHLPLDQQLERGIRQFELDIVFDPENEEVLVQHIPFLDEDSNCFRLLDCLETMRQWSDEHPWHFPLQVLIEPKDEVASWTIEGHFDEVDQILNESWGTRMWTPQDQQKDHISLRESVLEEGWPTLEQLRGHIVFVFLDTGDPRAEYTRDLTDISGRVMFPLVSEDHDFAAYFLRDNPFDETISDLVLEGFLIRSRGEVDLVFDSDRLEQAFAVGAHSVSVDTEESMLLIDASAPIACNPFSSTECLASELE
jgi:hypothetical protein